MLQSTKAVTEDQIRDVIVAEHTETTEETYDIYLLPPGEDPEACQSYLRMRNRDGKYNLMFEVMILNNSFLMCHFFLERILPAINYFLFCFSRIYL